MPEHTRSLPPDEIAERLQTFSQSRESVADVLGAPALQAQAPLVNRSPFEAHSKVRVHAGGQVVFQLLTQLPTIDSRQTIS